MEGKDDNPGYVLYGTASDEEAAIRTQLNELDDAIVQLQRQRQQLVVRLNWLSVFDRRRRLAVQAKAKSRELRAFQSMVLDLVSKHADDKDGLDLVFNPHLWATEDQFATYEGEAVRLTTPWNRDEWPVLDAFLDLYPNLVPEEVCLAYHGTKNADRRSRILFKGLDPRYRRRRDHPLGPLTSAYFCDNAKSCDLWCGELILFVVPRANVNVIPKGDGVTFALGTFGAQERDALPIATYLVKDDAAFGTLVQQSLVRRGADLLLRSGSPPSAPNARPY